MTSLDPLEIYVFSDCYIRLCGSAFSLTDITDNFKHLSNYTIQKKNDKSQKDELQMSNQDLINFINLDRDDKLSWSTHFFPKISHIAEQTIKSSLDSIEIKDNCFELFGLDLVLDEDLNFWLIEVNLSPACASRTSWLKEMVTSMSDQALDLIEGKIVAKNKIKVDYLPKEHLSKWIQVCNESLEMGQCNIEGMAVESRKVNLKKERKITKSYYQEMSAVFIQRNWR